MKKVVLNLCFLAAVCFAASCNDTPDNREEAVEEQNDQKFDDTHMEDDAEFVMNAADGGMMEVELGKLAQQKASDDRVKEFGQMMIDDHSKANNELSSLAQTKNITILANVSEDKQQKIDDLSQKSGKDFDKAYMDLMVEDHQEDVDDFRDAANRAHDADVKAWAADKLPVLEQHLQKAKEIKDAL